MNKKQLVTVIVACVVLLVGVEYVLKQKRSVADYRIALFVPAEHPSMTEIMRGFEETLNASSHKKYAFDEYNANGNPTLLRAQADEIVQHNYDLVFTIGTQCSHSIFELSKKRQSIIPQIFAAVDNPVGIGLVQSLAHPGGMATGTTETVAYEQQIDALLRIKHDVKTVLLVYNPAQKKGLEKNREDLEKILHAKNITLNTVVVAHQNEITQKVPSFLHNVDVLMILIDHTTVAGIDSLITLCGRYHVTLFASDLNSADKGAALAFGEREYDHGVTGARLAQRILEGKESPTMLSVRPLETRRLKINTKTMEQQGLHLSKEKLAQLQKEGVIVV
ncbi:MAG TPA: ABC transporter substrate-binding protein [Candidatus Babeliales bacterium]|nr:ABC transporter substrate-binding protein [Candidatus Babeliales bacterium]